MSITNGTAFYDPDPTVNISITPGGAFNRTFSYTRTGVDTSTGDPVSLETAFGVVYGVQTGTSPNYSNYLSTGTEVVPGIKIQTFNPLDLSVTLDGTARGPAGAEFIVTMQGTWTKAGLERWDAVAAPYKFQVTGGSPLTLTPSTGNLGIVNTGSFISTGIPVAVSANGIGPFEFILSGSLPTSIGLSTVSGDNTVGATPLRDINTASNTVYLAGNPSAADAGSYTFTITVIDKGTQNSPQLQYSNSSYGLTIQVAGSGSLDISTILRNGAPSLEGQPYLLDCTVVTGGSGSYNWIVLSGSLPGWATLNAATGRISGTPNAYGATTVTVKATDNNNGALIGTKDITLNITPNAYFTGTLPVSGTIAIGGYGPATLTAGGGDGPYNWFVKTRDLGLTGPPEYPGVIQGLAITGASYVGVSGGYAQYTGTSITFGGDPNTAVPIGYHRVIEIKISSNLGSGGTVTSQSILYAYVIAGANSLTTFNVTPGGNWIQHVSGTQTLTVTDLSGSTWTWSLTSGTLPSGITAPLTSAYSVVYSGTTDDYGSFPHTYLVSDDLGSTGTYTYNLVVAPSIWYTGTLPAGDQGTLYDHTLTFSGGAGTGFTYEVNGLPSGITATPGGSQGENLRFYGTPTSGGDYPLVINAHVDTTKLGVGTRTAVTFTPTIHINGGPVTLTPFTTTLCTKDGAAFALPKFKVGAVVTGGTTNTYNITAPAGFNPQGGGNPVASNNVTTFVQNPHVDGTFHFSLVSTEDGAATGDVAVTISSGSTSNASINPAGPVTLYHGEQQNFVATMPGTCSDSHGLWAFVGDSYGCTSTVSRGNATTIIAPATIGVKRTVTLSYQPDEDPDRITNVTILLVQGERSNFQITTTSPLPNATVGTPYTGNFTSSGGTGTITYSASGAVPAWFTVAPNGAITGTPPTGTAGTTVFTIDAQDSSTPSVKYTSKQFQLTTTDGGTVFITGINPGSGPKAGGTVVNVNGSGFLAGDTIDIWYVSDVVNVTPSSIASGLITFTTAASGTLPVNAPVNLSVKRSGNRVATTGAAWTYIDTAAGFSVASFAPTSAVAGSTDLNPFVVTGTGFDSSCAVVFHTDVNSTDHTLTTVFQSPTSLVATIPTAAMAVSPYSGTKATIKVSRVSDGSIAVAPTKFDITSQPLSITTSNGTPFDVTNAVPFSTTFAATGGDGVYTWSWGMTPAAQPLPNGLTLHTGTGVVDGTTSSGTSFSAEVYIIVTDGHGATTQKTFMFHVIGGVITFTTTSPLPDARGNEAYSQTILVSGGIPPYTFTKPSGSLPPGINLGTDGVVSGTTTAAPAQFNFAVHCADSGVLVADKTYSLNLLPALSVVTVINVTPAVGPLTGGTQVIVTGSGFISGCAVKFGQVASTNVQWQNATTLLVQTPPSGTAGVVAVSVINPDTGNGSMPNAFTYQLLTAPVIQYIDNQDGPFAGGQFVTLYGTNFNGITTVTFGLSQNASIPAAIVNNSLNLGTTPQSLQVTTPVGYNFGDGSGSIAVGVNIYATNSVGTGTLPIDPDNGYIYRPPPIITSVVPNTGSTAGGKTFYVLGKNFFERKGRKPRVFIGDIEIPSDNVTLVEK